MKKEVKRGRFLMDPMGSRALGNQPLGYSSRIQVQLFVCAIHSVGKFIFALLIGKRIP